jgi:ubiquinone/menaquinone biosynthesis C-methylase UbiE
MFSLSVMEEKYLEEAYDKGSKNYLFSRTEGKERMGFQNREMEQPNMFKLVPLDLKGKKLLDLGCGPGIHIKKYVERGAECFGIDLSNEMISLAKDYCPQANFEKGNIYDLKFEDDSFDIITASFVIDHVKDLDKGVAEIKRVLRKGGLFIFSIPHPINEMFRDSKKGTFIPSHSYYDTETAYHNIAGAGFKFPSFPRTLNTYFDTFLKDFSLIEFRENKIKESWAEVELMFVKFPHLAFFVWKKN